MHWDYRISFVLSHKSHKFLLKKMFNDFPSTWRLNWGKGTCMQGARWQFKSSDNLCQHNLPEKPQICLWRCLLLHKIKRYKLSWSFWVNRKTAHECPPQCNACPEAARWYWVTGWGLKWQYRRGCLIIGAKAVRHVWFFIRMFKSPFWFIICWFKLTDDGFWFLNWDINLGD